MGVDRVSVGTTTKPKIRPQEIINKAVETFMVSKDELTGDSRHVYLFQYRSATMYVIRFLTLASFPVIGKMFSSRDHTTVMSAVARADSDPYIGELVEELLEAIESER